MKKKQCHVSSFFYIPGLLIPNPELVWLDILKTVKHKLKSKPYSKIKISVEEEKEKP